MTDEIQHALSLAVLGAPLEDVVERLSRAALTAPEIARLRTALTVVVAACDRILEDPS